MSNFKMPFKVGDIVIIQDFSHLPDGTTVKMRIIKIDPCATCETGFKVSAISDKCTTCGKKYHDDMIGYDSGWFNLVKGERNDFCGKESSEPEVMSRGHILEELSKVELCLRNAFRGDARRSNWEGYAQALKFCLGWKENVEKERVKRVTYGACIKKKKHDNST